MLECRDIGVQFGELAALAGASIEVAPGEVVAIVGPSGCGKSTLLRVIAGLQRPDHGSVTWNGTDITHKPVHERGFGLMFQDYGLFPHRDVAGNVAFGLEMTSVTDAAIVDRVRELLTLVGLSGYEHRRVAELSGGEQQRVALARTLAPEPALVMLDEPIGSLDRALREELLVEMASIFSELDAAVIYVTHDQDEAFGVADRVGVMDRGRIVALDTPVALWTTPPTEFVAKFLGMETIIDATVTNGVAQLGWASVPVDVGDGRWRLVVTPRALVGDPGGAIQGVVASSRFRGGSYDTVVDLGAALSVRATCDARHTKGDKIRLRLNPSGVVALPTN